MNDPEKYSDDDSKEEIIAMQALNAINIRVPLLTAYRRWTFSSEYFSELSKEIWDI